MRDPPSLCFCELTRKSRLEFIFRSAAEREFTSSFTGAMLMMILESIDSSMRLTMASSAFTLAVTLSNSSFVMLVEGLDIFLL